VSYGNVIFSSLGPGKICGFGYSTEDHSVNKGGNRTTTLGTQRSPYGKQRRDSSDETTENIKRQYRHSLI
jgi:hypothetical protein